MDVDYGRQAKIMKVLSDANRLRIIDILSCGELCACDILENFDITQPTLSHHMKVLTEAGLVNQRKEGIWTYYSLDQASCASLLAMLGAVFTPTEDCICKRIPAKAGCSGCK